MGLYIDTSKLKWIFWTSHHRVLLIEMLLKSSRNLSNGTNRRSVLQISKNQSMIKMVLKEKPLGKSSNPYKGNGNTKKDIGKWCDFQIIPHHNIDECRS